MRKQEKVQAEGVFRRSSLIADRTKKMASPYIGSTLCVAIITLIDSLVAGISIGPQALAAIAASGPFLSITQILHCLLVYGVDKLMVREIGEGKRKEANRVFGAVLTAVIVIYLLVYILLLIFERPLLELLMEDRELIDLMIRYTRPLFLTSPLFEALLCIERAFRIDGRAKLFSQRGIITAIANIAFDILLVPVLGMNISGLAWASVIGSALGYIVTVSHFFSKTRTVSPDFSVLLSLKELLSYLKEDIRLGGCATLDELMDGLALSAQTAAVGMLGGAGGLAIWAVFKALRGVILSISNGDAASVSVHTGMLFSQKDYDGVRYSVTEGIQIALMTSLAGVAVVLLLAGPITTLHRIDPGLHSLCAHCLRIGSVAFLPVAFLAVVSAYLPAVNRIKLTNVFMLVQKGLLIISAGIGAVLSIQNFFLVYVIALYAAALVEIVFLVRDRFWFVPEHNPEMISDYSLVMKPDRIADMKADVCSRLNECGYPTDFCLNASLVVEDSANYIMAKNPDVEICADIQMNRNGDGVQIVIIDEGAPYNPINDLAEKNIEISGEPGAVVVFGISAFVNYDRVLELNHLTLQMGLTQKQCRNEG